MKKTYILPDIHGRTFWKDIQLNEGDEVIFLGDYLDPYGYEYITPKMALDNFREILDFVDEHKGQITMLIGNHDCSYIYRGFSRCRYNGHDADKISALFEDRKPMLKLAAERNVNNHKFIFTHGALLKPWIDAHKDVIDEISEQGINKLLTLPNCGQILDESSFYRGGYNSFGSVVWGDIREVSTLDMCDNIINVFGHTQLTEKPIVIDNRYVCLDCRRPFILTQEGEITELDGTQILSTNDKAKQDAENK